MSEPRNTPDYDPSPGGSTDWEMHPATPDRKLPRWFWIMVIVMGLAIVGMRAVGAAEPYVITLTYQGNDYDHVQRTHFVLGDPPFIYDDKTACDIAIVRVRIHLSGARPQCTPHYTTR